MPRSSGISWAVKQFPGLLGRGCALVPSPVEELRFYVDRSGEVTGPVTDDDLRDALRAGKIKPDVRVRLAGTDLWASPQAFATLAKRADATATPLPSSPPADVSPELPDDLERTPIAVRELLLFWLHEAGHTFGPLTGQQIVRGLRSGHYSSACTSLVDTNVWFVAARLTTPARTSSDVTRDAVIAGSAPIIGRDAGPPRPEQRAMFLGAAAVSPPSAKSRCLVCLEHIPAGVAVCPECEEPVNAISASGPGSIPDDQPGAGFFALHWRPLVTIGAMTALIFTGVALRHLAPGRFTQGLTPKPAAAITPAACSTPCWTGEACQVGKCVWQGPNDVGHVAAKAEPVVGGPFPLPKDMSDALPLDGERFAVAALGGLEIYNARTGGVLSLVPEAPQARRLYPVGAVLYATAPQRIYVIDAATTRILKTIETGAPVSDVTVGALGRRALASIPAAHAVAVLATEYHAEIDRIQFGDDPVGPVGADDTGKRALTTTGQVPLAGLRDPGGGAIYAFDPSRLASEQDRVRASLVGNPVSVLMTPDGETSYVVLRAEGALVPLTWLPSGTVRQEARIPTCREPEQIELVRRDRRAIVRCNEGRSIEVLDLVKREIVRHVPFNARVADLAIAPDGKQAIVALPADGSGFIGFVDLDTFAVRMLPVTAEPTRVRLAPDGSTALVLSDRAKVAWVIR